MLDYFSNKNILTNITFYGKFENLDFLKNCTKLTDVNIKNLRAKIDGENLKNAEAGGFMLSV